MEEFVTIKNKRGKAAAWQYFGLQKNAKTNRVTDNVAVCLKCDMVVKCAGGTTNLTAHIRRHHPSALLPKDQTKTNLFGAAKTTCKPLSETVKEDSPTANTIGQLFAAKYAGSSGRAKQITSKIARFLVKDMRPYSMVDSVEFKELLKCLDPRYTVPGRKVFSDVIVPEMYANTKEQVQQALKIAEQVSLTTDGWTSCASESYMTVTSCHITDTWELKNYVLQTRALPERHTGEHVADVLNEAVKEWSLPTLHGTPPLVSDNAANMVKAGELFGGIRIGCYAHTLNLAVQKALSIKRVGNLLAKIRRIVSFFHRSNLASNLLKVKAEALELPKHKLIIDVSTRWNSAFDMVSRFLEMQVAVFAVMRSDVGKVSEVISNEDLLLAEEVICLLKPLKDITVMLCTEHSPTVSVIMPLQHRITNTLLAERDADSEAIKEMKSVARRNLQPRYANKEQILNLCSALDALFKFLPFLSDEAKAEVFHQLTLETVRVNAVKTVKSEPIELPAPEEPELPTLPESEQLGDASPTVVAQEPEEPVNKKLKTESTVDDSILGEIFGDVYICSVEPAKSPLSLAEAEVQLYKDCPPLPLKSSPLQWWKDNEVRFPLLARVAKKYLCIPATSVPSERVFSTAGDILSAQRSRLKSKHVDALIFLKKNML